ncbi:MAG: hypothetical protein GYA55_06305 [SAR324 cluster bacterium]|uniref:Motility protein B-like N-terminal domain-containing protein n=1 Tax=SAR324 cluster bacterium TaxID=2024889 RepID=A0A7X9FRA5_9DELT|nr:hypothetical protein [SAR324 cluster bacterium]
MTFLEKKVQNIWLITFGDLLTLLLCFFIALITLSGAGYHSFREAIEDSSGENRGLGGNDAMSLFQERSKSIGTLIAKKDLSLRPGLVEIETSDATFVELSFRELDLTNSTLAAGEALKKELMPYFSRDYLKVQLADVEACSGQGLSGNGLSWSLAGAHAIQIWRQLIDLGVPAEGLRLRNLGAECSKMGPGLGDSKSPELAMRVTIKFSRS